uniref:Bifunctional inhibitor/plant lipid transfer protein/seed storage helical domain-containing protein n=1 Tax=Cajanus cajan TaxID=3821 RepID=A0A151S2E7_CAJCA|nr:hypothetical protein KK1_029351 [Cajanus cajan]
MGFRGGFVLCLVAIMVPTMLSQNAPISECDKDILSLSPCVSYFIVGGSPTPSCCSALSTLVKSPKCFCYVINYGDPSTQTLFPCCL